MSDIGELLKKIMDAEAFPYYANREKHAELKKRRPKSRGHELTRGDSSTFFRTSPGIFRRRILRRHGTDAGYMASV
jgi:hypothetical protein